MLYSKGRDRFYKYNEKSKEFISVSSDGIIHTYMYVTKKSFRKKVNQDDCIEY